MGSAWAAVITVRDGGVQDPAVKPKTIHDAWWLTDFEARQFIERNLPAAVAAAERKKRIVAAAIVPVVFEMRWVDGSVTPRNRVVDRDWKHAQFAEMQSDGKVTW